MDKLTGSEAVFGFCAWLTGRKKEIKMGSSNDCAEIVSLITTFCNTNKLIKPRENYTDYLTMPEN